MKKELREWRRKGGDGEKYKRKQKEYKELCDKKRRRKIVNGKGKQRR